MKKITIFPAIFIGESELINSVLNIPEDEILIIYTPDFAKDNKVSKNNIIDDFTDIPKLIGKIKVKVKDRQIGGIIAIDDELQFRLSYEIAKELDVPFYKEETLDLATNKFLMRKAFDENDVPSIKYQLIEDVATSKLSYPNVLKLLTGSGSDFLYKNSSIQELEKNMAKMKLEVQVDDSRLKEIITPFGKIDTRKTFLLEEFALGEEFSLDFLIDETVQIIRVVKKWVR